MALMRVIKKFDVSKMFSMYGASCFFLFYSSYIVKTVMKIIVQRVFFQQNLRNIGPVTVPNFIERQFLDIKFYALFSKWQIRARASYRHS